MRRESQGSASISAVVVFLSALLALGLMATVLPPAANVLSGFREGLRERGERGSELIRIYIHTANETELEPPIITIINGYDRESILTDYVVVARDGRVLAAGKMGGSLDGIRVPAGARIDLTPADFGLSYGTFAAMVDEVKAIYIRTAEGNSFGSSYGPPPKDSVDYQLNISRNTQHIMVIGTTTTRYNFTINGTLPILGDALVVKNVILVDPNGFVRGGVTAGNKWSDGSFDPNKIPDSVAALTFTDVVPINGYYAVPPFPAIPGCERYGNGFWVYNPGLWCGEVRPQFIEMVEFYPVEYYTPGSPVIATAYYARFDGERQTVYNPDLSTVVGIAAQRPILVQYAYGIPGTYTPNIAITYKSYRATVTANSYIIVVGTRTYTTTVTTPVAVWQEGGLVKFSPAIGHSNIYDYQSGGCYVSIGSTGGTKTCSFTITAPSRPLVPMAIKEVGYTVTKQASCSVNTEVTVTGPWGSAKLRYDSWSMNNLPFGTVSFELRATMYYCPSGGSTVEISGWAVYEYFGSSATAVATLVSASVAYLTIPTLTTTTTRTITYYTSIITYGTITHTETYYGCPFPWHSSQTVTCTTTTTTITRTLYTVSARTDRQDIDIAEQMRRVFVNGTETLSGAAMAHLAGTVQGNQIIKIKAPIVLLNYVYGIATSPPAPPAPSGGGGSVGGLGIACETQGESILQSGTSSSGWSINQPLESISGGTVSGFSVQVQRVMELRNVVCRPVTPPRSLPTPG